MTTPIVRATAQRLTRKERSVLEKSSRSVVLRPCTHARDEEMWGAKFVNVSADECTSPLLSTWQTEQQRKCRTRQSIPSGWREVAASPADTSTTEAIARFREFGTGDFG